MKVLIADDDRLVREMLSELLQQLGHAVVAAQDGTEALELCERERPDAVILDFLMPRLSGLDALQALRARGLRTPAVLLTALSDRTVRGVAGAETPDAFLEKPFSKRTVERALAQALRSA